ncbi:MAG: response regulator transcription factor [Verrucomicrobiae bacterium]|nr:response regulator transcription factor [Verrucomicrobiae bacterium]
MRILVVEDQRKTAQFIKKGLAEHGHAVDLAGDGRDAEAAARVTDYDLILLDVMLPGQDGLEVCRNLRRLKVTAPILMLTALSSTEDKVRGLDYGADDYLAKPFAFDELLARVRALGRRPRATNPKLKIADLELDPSMRKVVRSGKTVSLTAREFALLEFLMERAGQVITRTAIAERVWDIHFDSESNVIDVYVNFLRKKVDKGFAFPLIHTVVGVGYVLKDPRSGKAAR